MTGYCRNRWLRGDVADSVIGVCFELMMAFTKQILDCCEVGFRNSYMLFKLSSEFPLAGAINDTDTTYLVKIRKLRFDSCLHCSQYQQIHSLKSSKDFVLVASSEWRGDMSGTGSALPSVSIVQLSNKWQIPSLCSPVSRPTLFTTIVAV
jgi:hypothetical protein